MVRVDLVKVGRLGCGAVKASRPPGDREWEWPSWNGSLQQQLAGTGMGTWACSDFADVTVLTMQAERACDPD